MSHRPPAHRPGLTGAQRAQYWTEVQDMARGQRPLLQSTVRRAVQRTLGPQAGYGAVAAFTAVMVAALLSTSGAVSIGFRQLGRQHGVSLRALSRARAKVLPPPGEPTTAALLLRSHRGRLNVNTGESSVSRWYPGDWLLQEVRGRMRAILAKPRKGKHWKPTGRRRPAPPAAVPAGHTEHDTPSLGASPPSSAVAGEPTGQALYHAWKAAQRAVRRQ